MQRKYNFCLKYINDTVFYLIYSGVEISYDGHFASLAIHLSHCYEKECLPDLMQHCMVKYTIYSLDCLHKVQDN